MDSFPVVCVRLVVSDDEGRALLLRREEGSQGGGGWCLPGGKVDYGQTVEEAVARELAEETSLEAISARFLLYQDSLPLEPGGMHCVNLYFECKTRGAIVLNEESTDYAWVGPGELGRYRIVFRNEEGLRRCWDMKD